MPENFRGGFFDSHCMSLNRPITFKSLRARHTFPAPDAKVDSPHTGTLFLGYGDVSRTQSALLAAVTLALNYRQQAGEIRTQFS